MPSIRLHEKRMVRIETGYAPSFLDIICCGKRFGTYADAYQFARLSEAKEA
ncbi:MAG: hypothetical protein SP1CHLAM54_10290 [Chlamydiia bacterium]|nr:hypothetical protein [Chlamydiia bacterium]MCH9615935.1 hypothetical protein [Chlamydiia bacterium]MCH9628662.1 hypothetical protein [Chlamydiia bacterium]